MKYYECHITIKEKDNREFIKRFVKNQKWKFSAIEGDPNLGPGIKVYATRQFNHKYSQIEIIDNLNTVADLLESIGIEILRRKVELVIFDDRSSKVDACNGGCVECHLDDLRSS